MADTQTTHSQIEQTDTKKSWINNVVVSTYQLLETYPLLSVLGIVFAPYLFIGGIIYYAYAELPQALRVASEPILTLSSIETEMSVPHVTAKDDAELDFDEPIPHNQL